MRWTPLIVALTSQAGLSRTRVAAGTTRVPPTECALIGVVRVGSQFELSWANSTTHGECGQWQLEFSPIDSASRAKVGSIQTRLLADVAGNYIASCVTSPEQTDRSCARFLAVSPPEPGGRGAPSTFVTTTFGLKDWPPPLNSCRSSDRRYQFWCAGQGGAWVSPTSDQPSVIGGRTTFFAEPHRFTVSTPRVGSDTWVELAVGDPRRSVLGNVSVVLDVATRVVSLQLHRTGPCRTPQPSVLFRSPPILRPGSGYTLTLDLSPKNFNLTLTELNSSGHTTVANGQGSHSIQWRGPGFGGCTGDGGRTTLALVATGLTSSLRFTDETLLLPGLDPLRPWSALSPAQRESQPPAMPAILTPTTDGPGCVAEDSRPPLGILQPLSHFGYVDVTRPPFDADPTGTQDATAALQHAFDLARWHYLAVHIPSGVYTVTKTLTLRQGPRLMSTGDIPGPQPKGSTPDFLLDGVSSRYVPHVVRGSVAGGASPTLYLPPGTFVDAPTTLIDFHYDNPNGDEEPNAQYNTCLIGVSIVIGRHNPGAIGVRLRAAQGSGLEDVNVTFEGGSDPDAGLVGVSGGCGSGAAHHGIVVRGGRYGMDLRESQPAATISGVTLVNQSCAAVVYTGFETLSAVGVNVSAFAGPAAVLAGSAKELNLPVGVGPVCGIAPLSTAQQPAAEDVGMMTWIDSVISFGLPRAAGVQAKGDVMSDGRTNGLPRTNGRTTDDNSSGRTAFVSARSVVLQNTWVRGAATVVRHPSGNVSVAADRGWSRVHTYAAGVGSDLHMGSPDVSLNMPVYLDGVRSTDPLVNLTSPCDGAPPDDLLTQHGWGLASAFPSFESPGAIDVTVPPYGAVGDGVTDNVVAIQRALDVAASRPRGPRVVLLPKGIFAVSQTLSVPAGVALVGTAKHISVLSQVMPAAGLVGRGVSVAVGTPVVIAARATDGPDLSQAGESSPSSAFACTTLAFFATQTWNTDPQASALHWVAGCGVQRQLHVHRTNPCGALPGVGCAAAVPINHSMVTISGNGTSAKVYAFFLEDCCRNATFAWEPGAFWAGYLSGPQLGGYRQLVVTDGAGPVSFYHLNCEHGTGEAICEFSNGAHDVAVYGFKTEGNTVALWVRDCDGILVSGAGGVGCVGNDTVWPAGFAPIFPTLYRIQRSTGVLLANLMDQVHLLQETHPNMFNEHICDMRSVNTILWSGVDGKVDNVTRPFDRPVYFRLA
eukprot:m.81023 g.81023  ORF g.81023 m.81023 type:complete len:1212 (-) comp10967_c0_seq1:393-4028(-)